MTEGNDWWVDDWTYEEMIEVIKFRLMNTNDDVIQTDSRKLKQVNS